MGIIDNLKLAISALKSNWLRAILTLLIISIGIMALVGILTATDAIVYSMSENFSKLGSSSFGISPAEEDITSVTDGRVRKQADPISLSEAQDFKERYEYPSEVSISFFATRSATIIVGEEKTDPVISVLGVDENFLSTSGLSLDAGRYFSKFEVRSGSKSVIIGYSLAKDYYESPKEALDKMINVDGIKMNVIGVLEEEGSSMNSNSNNIIHFPLIQAVSKYSYPNLNYDIQVSVVSAEFIDEAIAEATGLMRSVRKLRIGEDNDFQFDKKDAILDVIKENTAVIRTGTIAIGFITILGASIGLMNIMFVSVTERTKEIGITKALGATRKSILTQFLLEAVFIGQVGGLVGIILGILAGNLVSYFTGGIFIVPWLWILFSIILCLVVGVVAGIIPAIQASKLDPIEALRHE